MGYFSKLAALGFLVVCRKNRLNSTTMFAVRDSDYDEVLGRLDEVLDGLPEWRLVDFVGDDAAKGAELLYQKLTVSGPYANWDERIGHDLDLAIGFEHRPESERFAPVED